MIQVVVGDLASTGVYALVRPATTALEPASSAGRTLEAGAGLSFNSQFAWIATPPLGTEPGALVMETTAGIMSNLIIQHLKNSAFPSDVTIVVGSETDRATLATFLERPLA